MKSVITPVKLEERQKLGIKPGDTVRVHQKIVEKGKTRLQAFEGLVLAVKHGKEAGATFTVRATLSGIGVERVFPLYAPFIEKIEIIKRSTMRRAKLYFIREKVAREMRRQLRNARMMNVSTTDFAEAEVAEDAPAAEAAPAAIEETATPDATETTEAAVEEAATEEAAEEKAAA